MTINADAIGQAYRLIWVDGDEQRHVTTGTIVAVDAEEVTVETEAGKQTVRLVDVDDAHPAPVLKMHEATIGYLVNPEVRQRFKVAVWSSPSGLAPVTAICCVERYANGIRWVVVDSATERDGAIVWSAGGRECVDNPTFPIVLGEVV